MSEQLDKKCSACHSYLFSDDDIVYCPECGAPHHRDCWEAIGHCANEENHGKEEHKETENKQSEKAAEDIICPKCHKGYPADAKFCPWCGSKQTKEKQEENDLPFKAFSLGEMGMPDPYGGVDKNSSIEGVAVKDLAKFIVFNPQKLLPKFKLISEGKKKHFWNWFAFLSPYSHALFRKMDLLLFAYLMLELIAYILFTPFYNAILNLGLTGSITYATLTAEILKNFSSVFTPFTVISSLLGLCLFIGVRLYAGFNSDRLYKEHAISSIKKIRENLECDDDYEFHKKGGIRFLSAMLIFIASTYFSSVIPPLIIELMFY